MKFEKYIHINYISSTNWGKSILSAIDLALKNNKISKGYSPDENILLYISIRLDMIKILKDVTIKNYNDFMTAVKIQYTKTPNCEFTKNMSGYALMGIDNNTKYGLLLNIDSLFFEIKSCWELVIKFAEKIYSIADKYCTKNDILKILSNTNHWYKTLTTYRNHFIHEASPYLAIDTSTKNWQLLIIHQYEENLNDNNIILFYEISNAVKEFYESLNILEDHLISLFN